jgi:hypothetical protein
MNQMAQAMRPRATASARSMIGRYLKTFLGSESALSDLDYDAV